MASTGIPPPPPPPPSSMPFLAGPSVARTQLLAEICKGTTLKKTPLADNRSADSSHEV